MPQKRDLVIETVFRGTLTPANQSEYSYYSFQVPPGALRIEADYEYEGQDTDTVLDIGLFGPGGIDWIAGDLRGWSGSFRREFFVMADRATPGYQPGPLTAGQWHIVLGLQRMDRPRSAFQVNVRVYTREPVGGWPLTAPADVHEYVEPVATTPTTQDLTCAAVASSPRWYRGDLHVHSVHSDGANLISELGGAARDRGLDFVALTDHNVVCQNPHLPAVSATDMLMIPGEEITSYRGHANVWGLGRWLDFRLHTAADAEALFAEAHRRGLLISINHPKDGGPDWEWQDTRGFDCVEVWQAPWWVSNYQALAWWDDLLCEGQRVVAVGGSDIHLVRTPAHIYPHELGNPTTWVWARSLTTSDILDGIRRGHVFLTAEPTGVEIAFTARIADTAHGGREFMMGDEVLGVSGAKIHLAGRVIGAEGCILRLISDGGVVTALDIDAPAFAWEVDVIATRDTYYRVEAIEPPEIPLDEEPAALMVVAMTNPIYVRVR